MPFLKDRIGVNPVVDVAPLASGAAMGLAAAGTLLASLRTRRYTLAENRPT
jgi:hypothetical protein